MAVIVSDSSNPKYGTSVASVAVNNGGSGYAINDVLTLTGGDANATCTVLTVDGSGVVLTISRTTVGSGYAAGTEATTVAPAGGSGCTIDITVQAGLSTVNGFYQAEAYNLGCYSAVAGILSGAKTQDVTFANAGNCQGVIIPLFSSYSTITNDRDVVVSLEENVASVWTTRASKTLTAAEICNNSSNHSKVWIVPFVFATPYAVTTAASTWRFSVIQSGGTTGYWYWGSSAASNPYYYISWCDNAVTFANNDCVVFKDPVKIDSSATFRGVLGSGDTVNATCAVICKGADLTKTNICNLEWENPPNASYTLTINGQVQWATGSGMRIGSSDAKIPYAQQAVLDFITPTVGTNTQSRFIPIMFTNYSVGYPSAPSLFLYGASPTTMKTTLASNAANTQPNIVTTDATGWAVGDVIAIGKEDKVTATNQLQFVINTISGTDIQLTTNLASARLAGATVFTYTGFGIKYTSSTSATTYAWTYSGYAMNYLEIEGVYFDDHNFYLQYGNSNVGGYLEETAYTDAQFMTKCVIFTSANATSYFMLYTAQQRAANTFTMSYVNAIKAAFINTATVSGGTTVPARVTLDNCVLLPSNNAGNRIGNCGAQDKMTVSNCRFENQGTATFTLNGIDPIIINNYFYGNIGGYGASWFLNTIKNSGVGYFSGNQYERCATIYYIFAGGVYQYTKFSNEIYGQETANTQGVVVDGYAWADLEFFDCTGSMATTPYYSPYMFYTIKGTKIRFVQYQGTANYDFMYTTYGNFVKCGDGLSDTTVHTSGTGKFSMRFEPITSTDALDWVFNVPTGDIQGMTMTVAVWCKINNATYYAGTHQKPRLSINYDNGTTVYTDATASTGWQLLSLTFTPTTTYGQIVITLSGYTDATTTNAYFYFDDFSILYPAGYQLDLGAMDLWANGLPITPPVATNLSALSVWTASTSTDYGSGTMGNRLKKALTLPLFVGLK